MKNTYLDVLFRDFHKFTKDEQDYLLNQAKKYANDLEEKVKFLQAEIKGSQDWWYTCDCGTEQKSKLDADDLVCLICGQSGDNWNRVPYVHNDGKTLCWDCSAEYGASEDKCPECGAKNGNTDLAGASNEAGLPGC